LVGLAVVSLGAAIGIFSGSHIGPAGESPSSATVAPTSSNPEPAPQPFLVKIDTTMSGGAFPVVDGITNLPDGTVLQVGMRPCPQQCDPPGVSPFLSHPYDQATGDPWPDGPRLSTVQNGKFSVGGWARKDKTALFPGRYVFEAWVYIDDRQPANVRAILGGEGEAVTGPLVGDCCLGIGQETEADRFRDAKLALLDPKAAADAKRYVYYGGYVDVPAAKTTEAQSNAPDQPSDSGSGDVIQYDPVKARRAAQLTDDENQMAACVEQYTPDAMGFKSRTKIKAWIRNPCVSNLVADGFMTMEQASALCDQMTDKEIDILLAGSQ
jgi:hypothetical protein